MTGNPAPREILKSLMQGAAPPRPLILPIVFALGARIENVPLRTFFTNATKIVNALRQLRGPLRADGVTCYFDLLLEAEALGGNLCWQSDNAPPQLSWPDDTAPGTLPGGLRAPEEAAKCGRVPVMVDVIRRLKTMFREEVLLAAGVSGPFTLAAQLLQFDRNSPLRVEDFPSESLELASSTVTQISSSVAEAGANVIFLHEEFLPEFSLEAGETWASLLAPTLNIIRFYEALSLLLPGDTASASRYAEAVLPGAGNCIFCAPPEVWPELASSEHSNVSPAALGIAIPLTAFCPRETRLHQAAAVWKGGKPHFQPSIVTTAGDIPATTDAKSLVAVLEEAVR
jgi:Uroporphyrinogen decarboxylase (URO-D)